MKNKSAKIFKEKVDVCIVGSGASGAVLAKELSEAGLSIIVLEVGDRADRSQIPTNRDDWEMHSTDFHPNEKERDKITLADDSKEFSLARFKGVGGSTMRYEGFSTRMQPGDWQRKTQYNAGLDWPINYEEIEPLYDRVENILGISGKNSSPFEKKRGPYPNPPIDFSCGAKVMASACEKLGLHPTPAPMAILSRPREGRASCNFCGGCWAGCAMGAISNASQTYIPQAEKNGVQIKIGAMVTKITTTEDGGKADGVEFLDSSGQVYSQQARAVVVCGNAIETPRLLLMSANAAHTDGLGNKSKNVGKYFMGHSVVSVMGLLKERVNAYKGPNINGMVQDFCSSDESRGFFGGYIIALRNAELGPLNFFHNWGLYERPIGQNLAEFMNSAFGHSISISAYGETVPQKENSVSLDPIVKDKFGLPVPRIRIVLHNNDKKMMKHMERTLKSIMLKTSVTKMKLRRKNTVMGTHLMGTCRMGTDPQTSVTNSFGQTHDIPNLFIGDGSLFPTSTPANPTLTIQALATRTSFHLIDRFKNGDI